MTFLHFLTRASACVTFALTAQTTANNKLVIGPWSHGGWNRGDGNVLGNLRWTTKTGAFYRDSVEFPFFMQHLKGAADPGLPEALVFRTGADEWDRYDVWPPREAEEPSLFIQGGGKLSFEPPVSPPAASADRNRAEGLAASDRPQAPSLSIGYDAYLSDPMKPVPLVDSSGFSVAGYQQLVRGEPFRGKFRKSFSTPVAFIPDQPDSIRFEMPDVNHTFRKGHRIMIQIQSSWFPHIDRNPRTFVPNIFEAKESDFQRATMRVYRDGTRATRLDVRVVRRPAT